MRGRNTLFAIAIGWLLSIGLLSVSAPLLPIPDPYTLDFSSNLSRPDKSHFAGTDELGRDVLSRIFHAGRSTFIVVVGATSLSLLIATVLGSLAGYVGEPFDTAIRVGIDLLWSVPFVIFVVLIVSVAGVTLTSLIVSIGVLNWVSAARIIRGEIVRLKDSDFVFAAMAHGYSRRTILAREILPNLRTTFVTLAAYSAIEVLTLETGLAFLGLSLPAPAPTWGGMLADGLSYFSSASWIVIAVSLAITGTLGSLQILARAVQKTS